MSADFPVIPARKIDDEIKVIKAKMAEYKNRKADDRFFKLDEQLEELQKEAKKKPKRQTKKK